MDERKFAPYWTNTSSNDLISLLLRESSIDIKNTMEILLSGGSFGAVVNEEIIYCQLERNKSAVWGLLLASGYLKILKSKLNNRKKEESVLAITNYEVCLMFDQLFMEWFSNKE